MASAALVSSITGSCMRLSSSSKTIVDSFGISEGRTASSAGNRGATVSRMDIIRHKFRRQGFLGPLVELLMAGNRTTTHLTYKSAWRVWNSWCVWRGGNPLSVPVNSVIEFLTELFYSKKSYSTINISRSMLYKTLPAIEGYPVGMHPLLKNLLNGCSNLNPSDLGTIPHGIRTSSLNI